MVMRMGGPDVDVGLGKGGEHCSSYSFPGTHLVAHSSQHAAVIYLLNLANAPGSNRLAKPAQIFSSLNTLHILTETAQECLLHDPAPQNLSGLDACRAPPARVSQVLITPQL